MNDLIARLEAAEEGSPELDAEIWCNLNEKRLKRVWVHPHWNYPHDIQVMFTEPPKRKERPSREGDVLYYTTSRDASLPGEDIRTVIMLGDGRWEAHALDKNGDYQIGEANTEALARRAAALKAIREMNDG